MRGLIIVILINIGLFAYSQSIIDYKPLYPVINLLPLASNESCFIFINKEKKLVFETQISNIIKSSQLNLDRITLEKLINIEAPFYSPSTNANYCMIRTWGRKDYKDAWYILNYDKQEKIFTFNKYFETGFGGVQSPPIMRDSESNYTFFYEIEYDPFKSNEGTTFELKLSKKGSVSETIIKGQGAPSYNYIGNDLFFVEEGYRAGGNIGWESSFNTYLYNYVLNEKVEIVNQKPIGFGKDYIITTNLLYNELNIYNSHLQLVYSIEEIKLLDPLNSLGLSTVHKAFKFSGRFLFFDICFPDNSLESYKTIIFDLKEGKSYITNDVNTELVGFF